MEKQNDKINKKENRYLFHQGTNYDSYKFMGCTLDENGAYFRVVAPSAFAVSVFGEFNGWQTDANYLTKTTDKGLWECYIKGVKHGDKYKLCIHTGDGRHLTKCDPYALFSEKGGGRASVAYSSSFSWTDNLYMRARAKKNVYSEAINIYEVHIGSWKKHPDGSFYSYAEFADSIVDYIKEMSYTHIELMGIAEYPFDGSWGYQITGYFSPTSRYGTPDDFRYLVNKCHKNGIGVILDWVPGHFPKDDYGLAEFDGKCFYEAQGDQRKEHKEWGTLCFDYGREEVQSFLVSNAVYWLEEFHIDGLRVDAVASMLYLDYNRQDDWCPNSYGGKENLDAIAFLKKVNSVVFERFGGNILMIAEESTSYPMVTMPIDKGGLGFNFKWNMGWMNDTLAYAQTDPFFRKYKHNNLSFSLTYAFSENFILPISHDEIVHGKKSLIDKMPGDYDLKHAGWRNFLMNMYSMPGKNLLMMGSEFAQFSEWDYKKELDWFLLDKYPAHKSAQDFTKILNKLYKQKSAFWQNDYSWQGFEWLVVDDSDQNVISYARKSDKKDGGESVIVCIYNFSPNPIFGYLLGMPKNGEYKVLLSSELFSYTTKAPTITTKNKPSHGKNCSITINIPSMSGMWLELQETVKIKAAAAKKEGVTKKAALAEKPKAKSSTKAKAANTVAKTKTKK